MKKTGIAVLLGCFIVCLLISLLGCKMEPDPQLYSVTFITDGGSTVASQSILENAKATRPATDPTKTGYSFDNWYTEASFANVWNFATPITNNRTLYAKWIADIYTVTFDSQDATTIANPMSKTVAVPATTIDGLPTAPRKTGYTFGGWFMGKAGSGSQFITSTVVTNDMTVYAKWMADKHALSFNANGGTGTISDIDLDTAEQTTLPSNTFTKTGYTFAGWATSSSGSVEYADQDSYTMGTSNETLYAKWSRLVNRSELITMITNGEDVTNINTSKITDMNGIFKNYSTFNQDISGWDVSSVTDMSYMFYCASAFNQDISGWDVSSVTDMSNMFGGASVFNQNLSGWDVSSVRKMEGMFSYASFFNEDISGWDVSNVTDMNNMFSGASSFNIDISKWCLCSVMNISQMFSCATSFNQDISSWDVSSVESMGYMFHKATSFNQNISGWDVSKVKHMLNMFHGATSFNQNISGWDVSKVKHMMEMFNGASSFNCDISTWNVGSVINMKKMFYDASSFNQNISAWNVSSVSDYSFFSSGTCPLETSYHPHWNI